MSFARVRLLLFILSTVLLLDDVFAADCTRRIAIAGPRARTIVLAGGDAWTLFRRFLAEVEQKDLNVSLWKVEVQLSRGGQTETHELGWAKALSGESAERLWERQLHGIRAEINQQLLTDAENAKWDVVCVGHVPPPPPPPVKNATKTPAPVATAPDANALVFYKSGMQYAARRDYANALKEFHAAEKVAPRFEGLQMNIGVAYLQLKDYVQASQYLSRAIEQNAKDANAHYNMACLKARLGQVEDAVASLAAAKSNGMKMTAALRRDSDLASLRGRTDFENLFK